MSHKINELRPEMEELEPILEINLDECADTIKHIFKEISSVKHVGSTSASKLLHMLKPETFVMWDELIAEKYTAPMSEGGYIRFLRKMEELLTELMKEYSMKRGWIDPVAELFKKYEKPITKLVEEYNWLVTRPWLDRVKSS